VTDLTNGRATTADALAVDLRNVYRPEDIEGFAYHGIGRPDRRGEG
jgi:hypothetical protein